MAALCGGIDEGQVSGMRAGRQRRNRAALGLERELSAA